MRILLSCLILSLININSYATIWHVGSTQIYTSPSQVSALVQNGDTVEIDSGNYNSDVCHWTSNGLLIKGINGRAQLNSLGTVFGGKAIWVISGDNTTVENIEFTGAACIDQNGAGIRQEGHNLIIRNCYFHNNEDGILAGIVNPSTIRIENSEFGFNGFGDGYSHNLYINNIDTLIFINNYSHGAVYGHELKSRANVNLILYNRLTNEASGTASRCIDLPNGGLSILMGNVIEQGPMTQNSNMIGYGLEGLTNPGPNEFYAINNTLVNDLGHGSFFQFQGGTDLFKGYNNIFAGAGNIITGSPPVSVDTSHNIAEQNISVLDFMNELNYDYHLTSNSTQLINAGITAGTASGISLTPVDEFTAGSTPVSRCSSGNIDIGAFEYCTSTGISETSADNIEIFPNPAADFVFIKNINENALVTLYSVTGKLLARTNKINSKLNLAGIAPGYYRLEIKINNSIINKSLIIK